MKTEGDGTVHTIGSTPEQRAALIAAVEIMIAETYAARDYVDRLIAARRQRFEFPEWMP